MPTHSSKAFAALLWLAAALPARAHGDAASALPAGDGLRLGAAVALSSLHASEALPAQGLPGYLLQGDPGVDSRGGRLEHAVLQAGWRQRAWSAELALGAHDSDPVHVETAWAQWRGALFGSEATLGAGRRGPALGALVGGAGHLDRFGPMPLARQAATGGDWIDDGVELGLQRPWAGIDWQLDLGLWAGRKFPGSRGAPPAPALHLGAALDTATAGDWALDVFAVHLEPAGRGSRPVSNNGGHTHQAPVCDASLRDVLCFDGRTRVAGLSGSWATSDGAWQLGGALLWRHDDGQLQSRDGLAQYRGHTRGGWWQLLWNGPAGWDAGVRQERLAASHALEGPGATLLAAAAGFGAYAPQQRWTGMLGYAAVPWATLRLEAGREAAAAVSSNFVALRLLLQWGDTRTLPW